MVLPALEDVMRSAQLIDIATGYLGVSRINRRPELVEITEGRVNDSESYAWCGDFATFVLMKAGVTDGSALNRASIAGKWTPGDNLARLQRWASTHNSWSTKLSDAVIGDYLIIVRNAGDHIGLVRSVDPIVTIDGNGWNAEVHSTARASGSFQIRGVVKTQALLDAVSSGYTWTQPSPIDPGRGIPTTLVFNDAPVYSKASSPERLHGAALELLCLNAAARRLVNG
jgi:hypothetical protein